MQLAPPTDVSPGPALDLGHNKNFGERLISQVDIQSLPGSLHPEISNSSIFKILAQLLSS